MSAKLHESLANGKLKIANWTNGEVMLYYPDSNNKLKTVVVPPQHKELDLLAYAPLEDWRRSPNLTKMCNQGLITVLL